MSENNPSDWARALASLACTPGQALYWDRVQSDVRLREMARRLGISPKELSDLENDRASVTLEIKERHAAALRR